MKCPDCGRTMQYSMVTDLWTCTCGYAESACAPVPERVLMPCCSCGTEWVNVTDGEDTCKTCLSKI